MKTNQSILTLAAILGLGVSAHAVTDVYIDGSTAFRSQVYKGMIDLGLAVANGVTSGANTFTFNGTINNSTVANIPAGAEIAVSIHCSFDGSLQGVDAAQNNLSQTYTQANGSTTTTHVDDLAFSDVQQASTPYDTGTQLNEIVAPDSIAAGVNEGIAVQPFLWAANAAAAADGVTNLNYNNAYNLFQNGYVTLNTFTGSSNSSSTNVVLTGRDNSSGTRITSQQLSQWPTYNAINQYSIGGSTTDPTIANVGTGLNWASIGNNGYSSGGKVGDAIAYPGAGPAVGYLSFADAFSSFKSGTTGAILLNWEGVSPFVGSANTVSSSTTFDLNAVINGRYDDWSYEHLYLNANDNPAGTIGADIAPALVDAVEYEISHPVAGTPQTAILIGSMNVNRETGDGIPITQGN